MTLEYKINQLTKNPFITQDILSAVEDEVEKKE